MSSASYRLASCRIRMYRLSLYRSGAMRRQCVLGTLLLGHCVVLVV
jgi:hypothetical protein